MSTNGAYYCSNYYGYHQCKNQVRNWGEKCNQCTAQGRTTTDTTPNPFSGSTSSAAGKNEFLLAPSEKLNPTRRGSVPRIGTD
ncbi:uncharacterized protein LAJ45_08131 [Morchella importuna]|uniref:uncharacterized protein n=1 Tax=Morchella importuna TaxID=1174673 RepID=UPI001E8D700A|nr:uncharacterized protein LAJ45_08131 [Morchella importuna]KAH8147667.1 hypothetical protein LAJ45_08131 [Morchella importuna]